MKIAIAGAGIAGLSSAIMLAKEGADVTVFERFAESRPIGSGFILQPNVIFVLEKLGIKELILQHSAPISRLYGERAHDARVVLDVHYQAERPAYSVERSVIHFALLKEAERAGVEFCFGEEIAEFETSKVVNKNGQQYSGFQLAIDARGAQALAMVQNVRPLKFGALWLNVSDKEGLTSDKLEQRYVKARRMLGIMPMGLGIDSEEKKVLFYSLQLSEFQGWKLNGIDVWRKELSKIWPRFAELLPASLRAEDVTFARYFHARRNPILAPHVVAIGDAAHATSPQLGQGANLALFDALSLCECLKRFPIDEALIQFRRSRRLSIWVNQCASWGLTPFYQSDSQILPWVRDNILAPTIHLPVVRDMLRKLASGELVKPIRKVG